LQRILIGFGLCLQLLAETRLQAQNFSGESECAEALVEARRQIFFEIIRGITTLPQTELGGILLGANAIVEARELFELKLLAGGNGDFAKMHPEFLSRLAQIMDVSHRRMKIPHQSVFAGRLPDGWKVVNPKRLAKVAKEFSRGAFVYLFVLLELVREKKEDEVLGDMSKRNLSKQIARLESIDEREQQRFDVALAASRMLAATMSQPYFLEVAERYQRIRAKAGVSNREVHQVQSEVLQAFEAAIAVEPSMNRRVFARKILEVYWPVWNFHQAQVTETLQWDN
jgi:hypothetical protein